MSSYRDETDYILESEEVSSEQPTYHNIKFFQLLTDLYIYFILRVQMVLKGEMLNKQIIATAQMIILFLYMTFTFYVFFNTLAMFRLRTVWKKWFDYSGYCLEEAEWANLKMMLGVKFDGRSLERNKKEIYNILAQLRKHSLYRRASDYNQLLPKLLTRLRDADDHRKFERVQNEIIDVFTHTGQNIQTQLQSDLKECIKPVGALISWISLTIFLNKGLVYLGDEYNKNHLL